MLRSVSARIVLGLALTAVPLAALVGGAAAKGTPSNVTATCGAGVARATVTVQLLSAVASPAPASNMIVLACSAAAPVATAKIQPLTQPADAYAWSAFVTAVDATFGCGGTSPRGTTATCTNDAGGAVQVTILAT
jgi:hypothetical protein